MNEQEWEDKLAEVQKHSEHWYNKYKELEDQIADIKANCDLAIEGRDVKIEELKKENAELKRENHGIKTCANCDEYVIGRCCNYPNGVCHHWKLSEKYRNNDELTKAKDFLNEFMRISKASDEDFEHDYSELIGEAEQFLKENGGKK